MSPAHDALGNERAPFRISLIPDNLIRLRLDESRAIQEYVRCAMNATDPRRLIESMWATTAGNIGIRAGRLKTVSIPVPPLKVQQDLIQLIDRLLALYDDLEAD